MKSKSLDCSRSASDSPSISGRDPSTHEMHSANAMPAQTCCHTALTVVRRVYRKAIRSIAHVASLAGRETRNSEFPGNADRQQTGFVFLGARTPQFTWQNDARFAPTVWLDPVSVAEPAVS